MVRGGMRDGMKFDDFEPLLTRAALAHYNDFGHSLIYVTKPGTLANRLGDAVLEPRLLSLVREMVYATREEKIPGFRGVPPRATARRPIRVRAAPSPGAVPTTAR